jgi:HPt (histidine-containing phosphotransfer) domain-containing protein
MNHGAIDPAVLDQVCEDTGGDGGFVIEIIDEAIADARERLITFSEAIRARDAERGRDAAHSLKGTSASVGALALADLAMTAERACRDGSITVASELIPELESAVALAASALAREKPRFRAGP